MGYEAVLFSPALVEKYAVSEIVSLNTLTVNYGLVLTPAQALALTQTRAHALVENGRVEFGGGVAGKIIRRFCDSPNMAMHDYEETLHELIEIFYYYKNETLDLISDDDLIKYMKTVFDGPCMGSLDLLCGRELYNLARNLRFGYAFDYSDETYEDMEDEYEEY